MNKRRVKAPANILIKPKVKRQRQLVSLMLPDLNAAISRLPVFNFLEFYILFFDILNLRRAKLPRGDVNLILVYLKCNELGLND